MEEIQVIYKKGKSNIEALVDGDVTHYGKRPIAEVIEESGGELMNFEVALELIANLLEKTYSKPFMEIEESEYQEMLEVLPPEVWMTGQRYERDGITYNVEGFRMCEYTEAQYTSHFYSIIGPYDNKRCFSAIRAADEAAPINEGVNFIMNAQANVAMGVYVEEILDLL